MNIIKKITITTGLIAAGFGLANADMHNQMPPSHSMQHTQQMHKEMKANNLNLTADQAKTLVEAKLIKHGKADQMISKVETINLSNNMNFYMVYVGTKGQDTPMAFFIVNAQNGYAMPYPKPKGMMEQMGKMMGEMCPHQPMNGMTPSPMPPVAPRMAQ